MKYATRLTFLTITLIIGGVIYLYFSGFFDSTAFAVYGKDGYRITVEGFEMLKSSIIWIPTLCAFLFGLCWNTIGHSIAKFAYDTDENDQIKKYKNWYERAKIENEEQLNEQKRIAKNARAVAESSVKYEKDNLERDKKNFEVEKQAAVQKINLLITNNETKQAELNQAIIDYNAAKEHFESSQENLDIQQTEFNSRREAENNAFHRATTKRVRKNNALAKLEYQYNQSQQYIRTLQARIADLESQIDYHIN